MSPAFLSPFFLRHEPKVALAVKNLPANAGDARDAGSMVRSLGREDPLEEGTAVPSSTLAWRVPQTESLAGFSPWGRKSQTLLGN